MTSGRLDSVPQLTVIVCTRRRGRRLADTARSILASNRSAFALCLVDQSEGDETRALLGDVLRDPRVRYVRCAGGGTAAGRNAAVAGVTSEWLAFTDDDCVVTADWLAEITAPLSRDERIGIVFGTIRPAPHDPALGFLPSRALEEPFVARSIVDAPRVGGLMASMAMRRAVWQALHGFDELFGPGTWLCAGEETDLVVRALAAGFFVCETPGATVIHSGFRTWAESRQFVHDQLLGASAALTKQVKRGNWAVLAAAGRLALRWAGSRPLDHVAVGSHRRARVVGLVAGVRRGLATPVDDATGHFGSAPESDRGPAAPAADEAATPELEAPVLGRGVFGPLIADRSPARLEPGAAPGADRVSIVMPSWNGRPFLERALTSLVVNTTYPYELIVVDNGSTDGSKEFVREFLRAHPRLDATFLDHGENRYFSTACNEGFRAASPASKYLAVYCNDVEATDAGWLQELVAAIQPDDVIAAGHAGLEPVTDRHRGVFLSYDPLYPDPEVKRRLVELITRPGARYMHVYGYCFLLKRALLERTGLYLHTGPFTQYHSDWEWCLRWAVMGFRVAPVAIGVHHWHSISELRAFYPDHYGELVRRLEDPATLQRYLRRGRPLYEAESGFRSRYATVTARAVERLRRRLLGT